MEDVLKQLGSPGRYHLVIVAMLAITWWSVALGNVCMAFYGYTPKFQCKIPEQRVEQSSVMNASSLQYSVRNITVADDQCSYKLINGTTTKTFQCTAWTFDDENGTLNTIVTEWSLVCDDDHKVSLSSLLFFVGVFFGALLFGFVSDYLGRKKTLALCLYTHMPISLAIAFVPDFISFTAVRFLLGVWLQGISTVAFVHCIEFFRQKYRGIVMVGFGISWAFGQMLTAFLAYMLTDWRHMQIVSACIAITTIPYFWWIPESPRWLLVKGRFEEITDVFITRAAKVNKLNVDSLVASAKHHIDDVIQQQKLAASSSQSETFSSILKSTVLLKRLIIMCYSWLVSSLAYYVFILNTRNLPGDRHVNFTIGACLEIVINFVMIFVTLKLGRKKPLIVFCSIVSLLCLVSGVLPKKVGGVEVGWVLTLTGLVGKMAMAAVLCLVFIYAAELFPTFARGGCMALCGCSLRLGSMLAPKMLYLRKVTFEEFPYILVAASIALPAVFTIFLPETFGKKLPNTVEEAVNLQSEQKICEKENQLLETTDCSSELTCSNASDRLTGA